MRCASSHVRTSKPGGKPHLLSTCKHKLLSSFILCEKSIFSSKQPTIQQVCFFFQPWKFEVPTHTAGRWRKFGRLSGSYSSYKSSSFERLKINISVTGTAVSNLSGKIKEFAKRHKTGLITVGGITLAGGVTVWIVWTLHKRLLEDTKQKLQQLRSISILH